ncbi:MAG: response regulator, partial [Magnetococcales bacterium]|nr:response regulator [Magnetococcales bacterium]
NLNAIKTSGNTLKLIVTDLNMPNMDGMTMIREVRKTDRTTPILMLTTVSQDDKKREGKEAGANGWAVKPLVPDVFLATVRKLTGL